MLAVFKKEFKTYFLSPIGYVVMGIFLLCFSLLFYLAVFAAGKIDLGGYLYYNVAYYGLIIVIPILTMRMFSEEMKTGTDQILMTSPTSTIQIVFGKLLAALSVMAIALVLSLGFYIIVSCFASVYIGTTLVAILGFLLIGIAALSLGMFVSSWTENQIIAGVVTIAFLILSLFLENFGEVFSGLSIINFYTKFAQGVISIENVIQLLGFSAVFILGTVIVLKRKKLVK